jgi:hypothetical protein
VTRREFDNSALWRVTRPTDRFVSLVLTVPDARGGRCAAAIGRAARRWVRISLLLIGALPSAFLLGMFLGQVVPNNTAPCCTDAMLVR